MSPCCSCGCMFPLLVSSFIFSFSVSFLSRFSACPFSFALFCFLLGAKGQTAAVRSRVSFRPCPVPLSLRRWLWRSLGSPGFGFSRGMCDHGALFPYPFACGWGGGERCGTCPGRAALSLNSYAQMSSCAELSLRKTGPEPDRGSLPGHGSGQLPPGGEAGSSCCVPGRYAGASGSGHGLFLCLCLCLASASPGLHAGDSGDMRGSGVLWETELLFTHRSSLTICQS